MRTCHRSIEWKKKAKTPRQAHANFLNPDQTALFRQMVRLGLKGIWPRWGFAEKDNMRSALERMDKFLEATGKASEVSFASITQDL